jgi:hypothetical protein
MGEELVGAVAGFLGSLGVPELPADDGFAQCVVESVDVSICLSSSDPSSCPDLPEVNEGNRVPSPSQLVLMAIQLCAPPPQMADQDFLANLNDTLRERSGDIERLMDMDISSTLLNLVRGFLSSLEGDIPATTDSARCVVEFVNATSCMYTSDFPSFGCPELPEGNPPPDEENPMQLLMVATQAIEYCANATAEDESFLPELNATLAGRLEDLNSALSSEREGEGVSNMVDFLSGIPILDDFSSAGEPFAQCVIDAGSHFICSTVPTPEGDDECPPLPGHGGPGDSSGPDIVETIIESLVTCSDGAFAAFASTLRNLLNPMRAELRDILSLDDMDAVMEGVQVSPSLLSSALLP